MRRRRGGWREAADGWLTEWTINVPFVVTTFVGLTLPLFASTKNPLRGRRLFWSGLAIAVGSAFFIADPPDWKLGLGLSLFVAAMMLFTAFFTTPYLKVGGKAFAFFTVDTMNWIRMRVMMKGRRAAELSAAANRGASIGAQAVRALIEDRLRPCRQAATRSKV